MTTLTDPPRESFRLSMLLYDSRYRSMTIQIIVLFAFMLGAAWLINNARVNLALAGKDISWSFLSSPSGYDINQRLLDYDSTSTHGRAAVIGLLNTLLVAVLGCFTATVLGVLIGILRLSKNWMISRLSALYVEAFRNVPVLLWIILTMTIMSELMPQPKDFRGDNPAASMILFDTVAVTNRGVYIPEPLFSRGLGDYPVMASKTPEACASYAEGGEMEAGCGVFQISLDLWALLAVVIASVMIAKLNTARANKIQAATGERPNTLWTNIAIIFLPVIAMLWFLGLYFGYPELKGFNFRGGTHLRNSLIALWLALSLYTAAFIAEIVRAGIMAISKGQSEAAAALGLRQGRIMRLVVLPQALRVIVPPLISQYLNLTKNSSLAIAVGYMDITGTLGGITLNQTGREMETLLLLMACYLIISLTVSTVMNAYNERTKLRER
ncbi:MAG TPA: ABC transporter permease subunit [Aliiroseovarius sp.]|nr:ABC transporter permease subunit [Aliiroseovarius sp.]